MSRVKCHDPGLGNNTQCSLGAEKVHIRVKTEGKETWKKEKEIIKLFSV